MRVIHKTAPAGKPIDITDSKNTGVALALEIQEKVKDTQQFIIQPLPDKVMMTEAQFDSLQFNPDTADQFVDRMFVTDLNVMEVVIVNFDLDKRLNKALEENADEELLEDAAD